MHSVFTDDNESNWCYTTVKIEVTEDIYGDDCVNQSENDRESRLACTDYKY